MPIESKFSRTRPSGPLTTAKLQCGHWYVRVGSINNNYIIPNCEEPGMWVQIESAKFQWISLQGNRITDNPEQFLFDEVYPDVQLITFTLERTR